MLPELESLIQETDGEVKDLLIEAASFYGAAESGVAADVDKLASMLCGQLPGLSYEEGLEVAQDLIARYSSDSGLVEADWPIGHRRQRIAPDPRLNDQYAPGKADYWTP